MTTIQLGQEVKDRISGLQGIVTSITTFLYGCRRVGITPREIKDGKPMEDCVIDEPQLEIISDGIKETAIESEIKKAKRNYGDPAFVPIKHTVNTKK